MCLEGVGEKKEELKGAVERIGLEERKLERCKMGGTYSRGKVWRGGSYRWRWVGS